MRVLADTQILIWYVIEPDRLSAAAARTVQEELHAQQPIGVSAFSLVEIAYAVEKPSNPLTGDDRVAILDVLRDPETPFEVVPVDLLVAERVASVPRITNADPGDRIIVATAESHGLALISADTKIPGMTTQEVIW